MHAKHVFAPREEQRLRNRLLYHGKVTPLQSGGTTLQTGSERRNLKFGRAGTKEQWFRTKHVNPVTAQQPGLYNGRGFCYSDATTDTVPEAVQGPLHVRCQKSPDAQSELAHRVRGGIEGLGTVSASATAHCCRSGWHLPDSL